MLGLIAKAVETTDAKVERFVEKKFIMTDMLLGERVGIMIYGGITGPFLIPLKLFHLLDIIDIHLKGHSPSEYGMKKKETIHDYLF